jgi:gamma-glutamylcyclotransferase (GGCT)/AIG2-like uncharacterized protein YtfP
MTYRDPKTGRWAVPNPFGDHGGGLSQPLPVQKTFVFVYGTLKQGYGNHYRLLRGSEFFGQGTTASKFRMLDAGFPVLIPDEECGKHVVGEVYRVDAATLARLDQLEGEGHMYDRKTTTVELAPLANGRAVIKDVDIYIGCPRFWDLRRVYDGTDQWTNENDELVWDLDASQKIIRLSSASGEQVDG